MDSFCVDRKPHAVLIPYPAQGHINPMLKLAKLLHFRGFHITFVHTDYNYNRLLRARGPSSLDAFPHFSFETIPDGLPPSDDDDDDVTQDIPTLCFSTRKNCLAPFLKLLAKLNHSASSGTVPQVSCIVSDGAMSFTLKAAEALGLPIAMFWPIAACSLTSFSQIRNIIDRGLVPIKDESCLDTELDWIPGVESIRLRELPSFVRTTDRNDLNFQVMDFIMEIMERGRRATANIINTFDELEPDAVSALSTMFPSLYTIGPVHLLCNENRNKGLDSIGSNLWKEEDECIQWLDSKQPNSVVYVNYGSITVMTPDQLTEFAWGLANSKKPFLWIIRADLVSGGSVILSSEFVSETKDRGVIAGWCPQEQVLSHPAIGGFLTHCGWNSTIESMSQGVPLACWPFFADQQTNCRFACKEWGVGMEIDSNVKRDEVQKLVNELMEGENGKAMKAKGMEWKKKAEQAVKPTGSSSINLDRLINEVLLKSRNDRENKH